MSNELKEEVVKAEQKVQKVANDVKTVAVDFEAKVARLEATIKKEKEKSKALEEQNAVLVEKYQNAVKYADDKDTQLGAQIAETNKANNEIKRLSAIIRTTHTGIIVAKESIENAMGGNN